MAERDTLLSTLPDDVRDDAEALYTDTATQDPRDVLAELHRRGRIDSGQLRNSVLLLEAQLRIRRIKEKPPEELEPTVLGPLGEGAMGEVLLARDEGLNRVVALKRLHPDHANHPGLLRRFYTEAQVTAQLDHPSIVPVHGVYPGEDGSIAYSMKLVRGVTLEDYLEEAKRQEQAGAPDRDHNLQARLHRFLHVCDAIAYAHSKGVLHRDLKPENIMVGAFGEVLVMDWGIAKLLEGANVELLDVETGLSRKATETRVGRVVGTPRYMSPEQAAGKNDIIDARSDQYAMGLILQELVTFTPAYPENVGLEGALARAQKGVRQPMKASAGAAPEKAIVAIVDKACALDPANRYDSVHDLAEDIRRFLRDEPVLAKPDGILDRLGRFISRHRTGVLFTMVVLGFSLLSAIGVLTTLGLSAQMVSWSLNAAREAHIQRMQGDTSKAANLIDQELLQIESLVVGLSFTAERSLRERIDVELPDKWDPNKLPPYAKRVPKSKLYGRVVLADYPTMSIAKKSGDIDAKTRDDVARLFSMAPQMGRALGDSKDEGDKKKPLNRSSLNKDVARGMPARWVRVGTTNGVMATAPGGLTLQRGVDPRKTFWYQAGKDAVQATWVVPPAVDPDLNELVLTVAHPVFDEQRGRLQAVVSLDLSLDEVIERMRASREGHNAWLLDEDGRVVATKSMRGAKKYAPEPFPSSNLWKEQIRPALDKGEGGFGAAGSYEYAWMPLTTVKWVLVTQYY